jgi:hypothetical protein
MFSSVKSKAAVIAGVVLTMATLSSGQGFHLEWEIDSIPIFPYLPSYIPIDGSASGSQAFKILWPHNVGNEYDLENDGIADIMVELR